MVTKYTGDVPTNMRESISNAKFVLSAESILEYFLFCRVLESVSFFVNYMKI